MPVTETKGAASSQGFGEFARAAAAPASAYIENLFSTYLYAGTGSAQSINNGIDLAGKGGLVWGKARNTTTDNVLMDTAQGTSKYLISNSTAGSTSSSTVITAFNANGYTLGTNSVLNGGYNYVGWTFRKQAKFFDVVTWTGNGANRTISHSLGSVPGCIIVKRTDTTALWPVYHTSIGNTKYQTLNDTNISVTDSTVWNNTSPTSTDFSVGTSTTVNANTGTYVAYLFANNAGGFGLAGTDNVITCGTFTTNGSGVASVTLGYEPQWCLIKQDGYDSWFIYDTMRGMDVTSTSQPRLFPNLSSAESNGYAIRPNATGFTTSGLNASVNFIYIAIRRGPMKTPTSGTSVFSPITANAAAGTVQTTNFVIDSQWKAKRALDTLNTSTDDRLRGVSTTSTASGRYLITSGAAAEATTNATTQAWNNTGFAIPTYYASSSSIFYSFGRAPGFFDVVCYTGTGSATTVSHNLGVVPELMIVKNRPSAGYDWATYNSATGNTKAIVLNSTGNPITLTGFWNNTSPTSSVFTVGNNSSTNRSGEGYVAYLFASCPGVSKVGSYTGTGTLTTINCGFTGGARFVLIRRTDAAASWFVWDTARGMVAGTDPSLALESTAAESNANSVYSVTSGFQLLAAPSADVNTNGGTYIYLAIA